MIIPLITFVVFVAGIYSAYWAFVLRPEQHVAGVVRRRLRQGQRAKAVVLAVRKQTQKMSSIGVLDALVHRAQSQVRPLELLITQAGVRTTVGGVIASCVMAGAIAGVIVQMLAGVWLFSAIAACAALPLPLVVLRFKRTLRMRKFEEQFPEALDLLARALRAGHAFTTGIDMVATEMPQPVGPEFRLLHDQQNFGMPMPDAMREFAERIPVLDARFFATAVLIQREAGGNLSEVLDNLAGVMRDRFKVKRQMRVISAHGRITGWILVGLPPTLFVIMMAMNQEYRTVMLGDPLGIQMLMGAGVAQAIGALIIRKIVNVEY
jgi:tight adherence protein B